MLLKLSSSVKLGSQARLLFHPNIVHCPQNTDQPDREWVRGRKRLNSPIHRTRNSIAKVCQPSSSHSGHTAKYPCGHRAIRLHSVAEHILTYCIRLSKNTFNQGCGSAEQKPRGNASASSALRGPIN